MRFFKTRLPIALVALLFAVPLAFGGGTPAEDTPTGGPAMTQGGMYNEAPMLAELVAAGDLPPVDERLPNNPKVHDMIEGIGNYGGELRAFAVTDNIWEADLQGQFGVSLFRRPVDDAFGIEGDLAEGFEINSDRTILTVFLREGLKWSDGAPFTTEDIRFMHEDMHHNSEVATWGDQGIKSVEVIDDYTIELHSPAGLGSLPLQLSAFRGGICCTYEPAEYLKQFHAGYNEDAQTNAEEAGFESWTDYFGNQWVPWPLRNLDKPETEAWELTQFTDTVKVRERNPYFWRVDPEGNQLPYIDRVVISIVNPEVYQLKVSGGEASIAYYRTTLDNLPLYQAGAAGGDYRIQLYKSHSTAWAKMFTVGRWHKDDVIRGIFRNIDFRRALSVALDRNEINNVIYQGLGVPGRIAPLASVSFYQEGWRDDWAQYDPGLASELLDSVGLDERDSEGFRMLPDGRPFNLVIDYGADRWTAELELYSEQYRDIGLRAIIKLGDPGTYSARRNDGEAMLWVHNNPIVPQAGERQLIEDYFTWHQQFDGWLRWINSHDDAILSTLPEGEQLAAGWELLPAVEGWEYPTREGNPFRSEEPPQEFKEWRVNYYQWVNIEPGTREFREAGVKVYDYVVEDMGIIGAIGEVPSVIIAKNDLGNVVTEEVWPGTGVADLLMQSWMDQLYWK